MGTTDQSLRKIPGILGQKGPARWCWCWCAKEGDGGCEGRSWCHRFGTLCFRVFWLLGGEGRSKIRAGKFENLKKKPTLRWKLSNFIVQGYQNLRNLKKWVSFFLFLIHPFSNLSNMLRLLRHWTHQKKMTSRTNFLLPSGHHLATGVGQQRVTCSKTCPTRCDKQSQTSVNILHFL